MPKHAIKIPARQVGRRVRWTLEVSADAGEEDIVPDKPTVKSRAPVKPKKTAAVRASRPRVRRAPTMAANEPALVPDAPVALETLTEAAVTTEMAATGEIPAAAETLVSPATPVAPVVPTAPAVSAATTVLPVAGNLPRASGHAPRTPAPPPRSSRGWPSAESQALIALALAILVVAAIALPRFSTVRGARPAEATRQPDVQLQPPQTATAEQPTTPAPVMPVAPPVAEAPPLDVEPAAPVTARRSVTEKPTRASSPKVAATAPVEPLSSTPIVLPVTLPAIVGDTAEAVPPATTASAATSANNADAAGLATVSLTGCLEVSVDDEHFRLTDTQGTNVPKARSWRSGFLTKRSAPVALIEIADALVARKFVGQRVVATGLVDNRAMRVRSLQAAGGACGQ